jgi:CubicO group peptidase (beta-lactamase class C family)
MNAKLRHGTPQEAGMSPQRVQYVANLAAGWVEQGVTPALVVLAARRGIVVLHEAYGRMGPEEDAPPLQRDAIFPLASITKVITATAAMILVEDGLLGLNRPVQWYLPEFVGEGKEAVMVHHLLTHTSGLCDEEAKDLDLNAFSEKKEWLSIPPCEETQHPRLHEYLSLRYDVPLCKPPGAEMSYCTYGYELLGEIVRRVSGRSLAGFCQERIFQPLGMADTHYIVPDSVTHRIVRRPSDAPFADVLSTFNLEETPWAGGGVYSTAMDTAKFGQIFLNRGIYGGARVLCPASVAEMTRNQIPGISARFGNQFFPEASWGLGWSVHGNKKSVGYNGILQSPQAFAHGGAGGVLVWVDPAYEIVGAYFSVQCGRGIPAGVQVLEEDRDALMACRDLFIDAVTASVVD